MSLPNCPKCNSEYVYEDGILLVCPECAYEWDPNEVAEEGLVVLDSKEHVLKIFAWLKVITTLIVRLMVLVP